MESGWIRVRSAIARGGLSLLTGLLCALTLVQPVRAEELVEGFDTPRTTWQLQRDLPRSILLSHRRQDQIVYAGTRCEEFQFISNRRLPDVSIEHSLPPTPVFDELSVSLWMRSNLPGAALALRLRLPFQIDPRTGEEMRLTLRGSSYSQVQGWQQLVCRTDDESVQQRLQLARAQFATAIEDGQLETRGMFVEAVVIEFSLPTVPTEILLDEMRFGPLVQVGGRGTRDRLQEREGRQRLDLQPDRTLLDGRPVFLRTLRYNGEQMEALADVGVNTIWVPNWQDEALMLALQRAGLWSTASPPAVADAEGTIRPASSVTPAPLTRGTESILFWTLGKRIPADKLESLGHYVDQTRAADRLYTSPRPVLADVVGLEREFSRRTDIIGVSRHTPHISVQPIDYLNELTYKRNLALPGKFTTTWIATEPSVEAYRGRPRDAQPPVVEPEQIFLQAYTAILAGYRSIGFWSDTSLEGDEPGQVERRLAMKLLNLELDLVERWLGTGHLANVIPVELSTTAPIETNRQGRSYPSSALYRGEEEARLRARQRELEQQRLSDQVRAAVIQSEYGILVIPLWLEHDSQYQPGEMSARGAKFVVRGLGDARAWEVTTTGLRPLEPIRVTGGTEIHLDDFDSYSIVLITGYNYEGLIENLTREIRAVRDQAARDWVDLADAKYARVKAVHDALQVESPHKMSDAPLSLLQAKSLIEQAEYDLQRQQYDQARRGARRAMQLLRFVQRAHWRNAVRDLTAPVSSPHAVCYQTLPDHWRMLKRLGAARSSDELLRSGDFEDANAIKAESWGHWQSDDEQLRVDTQLWPTSAADGEAGEYCMRMTAAPVEPSVLPRRVRGLPIRVATPSLFGKAGQVVQITGRIRIDEPITGHPDGVLIYDDIRGTFGALRYRQPTGGWQNFELLREIVHSGEFHVHMELRGFGEVQFDDIRVRAYTMAPQAEDPEETPEEPTRPRRSPLDLLPTLPKFPYWPGRGESGSEAETPARQEASAGAAVEEPVQ